MLFGNEFLEYYESFTAVLCAAAKTGCTPEHEAEYGRLRQWFVAHYQPLMAGLHRLVWNETHPAWELSSRFGGKGQICPEEMFKSLFLPVSLQQVLDQDEGELLPRIMQISEAVYRSGAVVMDQAA